MIRQITETVRRLAATEKMKELLSPIYEAVKYIIKHSVIYGGVYITISPRFERFNKI